MVNFIKQIFCKHTYKNIMFIEKEKIKKFDVQNIIFNKVRKKKGLDFEIYICSKCGKIK